MKKTTFCLKCNAPRNPGSDCLCLKENIWDKKTKEKKLRRKNKYYEDLKNDKKKTK